jgi:rSAM/selenodomain-associated transferase 2
MISVIVPTLNAEQTLGPTLAALVPAAMSGLVRQVIVADGGSADATLAIAEDAGCDIVPADRGRGVQLAAGAAAARGPWLLFLHADTVLAGEWELLAERFIKEAERDGGRMAASFRFALDLPGYRPRMLEKAVALRCRLLALPYGDQGLLISRAFYDELGGFEPIPIMEDVSLVRRIRRRLKILPANAVTSAERYRRDGFLSRSSRNLACLSLYFLRVPPRVIARLYG